MYSFLSYDVGLSEIFHWPLISTISNTRATFAYHSFCDNLRLHVPLRYFLIVCYCFCTILNYYVLSKSDVIKITCTHSMAMMISYFLLLATSGCLAVVYSAWSEIAALHLSVIVFSLDLELRLLHSFGTIGESSIEHR